MDGCKSLTRRECSCDLRCLESTAGGGGVGAMRRLGDIDLHNLMYHSLQRTTALRSACMLNKQQQTIHAKAEIRLNKLGLRERGSYCYL